MAEDPLVLCLRLEGPLQSWGDSARWSVRGTRLEPTKSGVIGMIAAASGWSLDAQGDRRVRELARAVVMGVRVDRPGTILRDYHTVGGARSGSITPWTGVLMATGKIKPGHTEVSERSYLADACFLVGLSGPRGVLETVEEALTDPSWPPFLGRKSCVPSVPVYPALPGHASLLSGSLADVLSQFPWLGRAREERPEMLRLVLEDVGLRASGVRSMRQDVPVSFSRRVFQHRYVIETVIPVPKEVTRCTSPN